MKASGRSSGSFIFGLFGLIVALIATALIASRRQIYWTLYPKTLFPHNLAATPDGVLPTCENITFEDVRTFRNVHSFDEAVRILRELKEPVLFKNFLPNADEVWKDIYEMQKKTEIAFEEVRSSSFGNLFFRGAVKGKKVVTSIESVMNTTFSEDPELSLSASFVQFLDDAATAAILPGLDRKKFLADSNFISNFHRDVVSTSIHAASFVSSYAFMLHGTKEWVFVEPSDYEAYNIVSVPDPLPVGTSEAQLLKSKHTKRLVVQRPGDLLAFPPQWAHAVITMQGPSVMLNLREFRFMETMMSKSFFRGMQVVIFKLLELYRTGERRDNSKGLNPLMEPNPLEKRTWHYEGLDFPTMNGVLDSGCKDFFIDRLYATDK